MTTCYNVIKWSRFLLLVGRLTHTNMLLRCMFMTGSSGSRRGNLIKQLNIKENIMTTTSNKNARKLVDGLTTFKGSNTFAETNAPTETRPTNLYIVYSYGYHFPMYIAEWLEGESQDRATWYENTDKYSQSTTRQQSHCRPSSPTIPMTTEQMKQLSRHGIVGVVVQPERNSSTRMTEDEINQAIHNISNSKYADRLQAW